jgi:hypothetical protein
VNEVSQEKRPGYHEELATRAPLIETNILFVGKKSKKSLSDSSNY